MPSPTGVPGSEIPKAGNYTPIVPYRSDYNNNPLHLDNFSFWAGPVLVSQNKENQGELYVPGFEGPTYATNPFDFVVIKSDPAGADKKTPGLIEVAVTKDRRIDLKESPGKDGATATFYGLSLARIDFRVRIWTPEQYRQWLALWSLLFPGPAKVQKKTKKGNVTVETINPTAPVGVDHPVLRGNKVNTVVFLGATGPVIGSDRVGVISVRAIEYIPDSQRKNDATRTAKSVQPVGSINDPAVQNSHPTPGSDPSHLAP